VWNVGHQKSASFLLPNGIFFDFSRKKKKEERGERYNWRVNFFGFSLSKEIKTSLPRAGNDYFYEKIE
jgi:hypothetical protein